MTEWDAVTEVGCREQITRICDDALDSDGRERAWQALLVMVAPSLEKWALESRSLRRWNLANEDDARSVLVGVIARLRDRDHENLRRFLASLPVEDDGHADPELATLDRLGRLVGALDEGEPEAPAPASGTTPFRGWLITLVGYVATDHLRSRLGWSRRDDGGPRTKRDVGTDAPRLSSVPDSGARPPITDYLTLRRLVGEIDAFVSKFPDDMKRAFSLWLEDSEFTEIAVDLGITAESARKLVRAAQARLRKEFRGRWDAVRGAA